MLYGFMLFLFIILSLLLMMLVLVQKGKGSTGLGSLGGESQMLFGGSGGQDFLQKLTWVLGAFFMVGSLVLALIKASTLHKLRYAVPVQEVGAPSVPHSLPELPVTNEQHSQQ
jgi:preprotein translocase subunit SecG